MTVARTAGRLVAGVGLCIAVLAGCTQPTPGTPRPDAATAEQATADAVKRGIDAFQNHFGDLGDEHARVYNYLNYGDTKITTEHESYKVGDPPVTLLRRNYQADGEDWSQTLHPADAPLDYVELDEAHAFLAPTTWVSVPTLYQDGFDTCFLLTAWVACHLDTAIGQTNLDAPDRQPSEARATEDGFEVVTGALLGEMLDEGFISVPESMRDEITEPMRDTVVPVTIRLDHDMRFTGFEIREKITDGQDESATPLELQLGYEVLGEATEDDIPEVPQPAEITAISDPAAVEKFWEDFNDRDPSN